MQGSTACATGLLGIGAMICLLSAHAFTSAFTISYPDCQVQHVALLINISFSHKHNGAALSAGLNDQDKYFMKACPAKKGDYFEFFAEIDILGALSTCPGGDLSVPLWGPNARDPLEVCRPLGVEVYKVHSDVLTGWQSPQKASYAGRHGLAAKPWA